MDRIVVQLAMPVYLKKILEIKYGDGYSARNNRTFGIAAIESLYKKSDRRYTFKKPDSGNAVFSITFSYDRARHKGFDLNINRARQLVKSLDRDFREDLYITAIINHLNYGIDYQTTIRDTLEFYDISEDELQYDSLRKDFNRNKSRIEDKINKKSV